MSLILTGVGVAPALASNTHSDNVKNHSCGANIHHRWTSERVFGFTSADGDSAISGVCEKLYVAVWYKKSGSTSTYVKSDYAYGGNDFSASVAFDKPSGFDLQYSTHKTWTHYFGNCGTMGCEWLASQKTWTLN